MTQHQYANDIIEYDTQFLYPGNNRQMLCRCTNYDPNTHCVLHNKDHKKLRYHFIKMPPIKKPNGALLGHRCSAICEQTFSITIGFQQSVFNGMEYDVKTQEITPNPNDVNVLYQNHLYINRRAIYGQVKESTAPPIPLDGGLM